MAGGGLRSSDRKVNLLYALDRSCAVKDGYQEPAAKAGPSAIGCDIYAPNPALVPHLGPWFAVEAGHPKQRAVLECTNHKRVLKADAQPLPHLIEAELPVVFKRCTEGFGIALQGFEAETPPFRGIIGGKYANFHGVGPLAQGAEQVPVKKRQPTAAATFLFPKHLTTVLR